MNHSFQPFTSIGSLTKKIMVINPDLNVHEIISLIRQATRTRRDPGDGYASTGIVDESYALELAKATLIQRKGSPREISKEISREV